nr:UDP-galactopyranose mutase [uncultured Desulfobacter sp.]
MYDYLIVGTGLFGATFAYEAQERGKSCLLIDRRDHIGGNIYCENIEGINVHKYGAHIFHTSSKDIWDYVNQFTEFNRFTNMPVANYQGQIFNLPFNMNTFNKLWGVVTPQQAKDKIAGQRKAVGVLEAKNLEEQAISLVGTDIYEKLIKGYTEKQWGRKCSELPAFIIQRLPVRYTYDNNYFNDTYQGIPIEGYNAIIEKMLKSLEVRLNTDFFSDRKRLSSLARKIVFTGMIDEFYEFRFGHLEYRSLKFEHEILDIENYQGNAVVNYTDSKTPFTRIIEHKHFEFGNQEKTVITREFPSEWETGNEPYYPINNQKNNDLFNKYKVLASKENNLIFGGRLADYKYYDMHHVIAYALETVQKEFNESSWSRSVKKSGSVKKTQLERVREYYAKNFVGNEHDIALYQRHISIKRHLLDILNTVHRICQKNNISFYPLYGTMLGAVRHKGFIPWDVDVDIAMMRNDYDRFMAIVKESLEAPYTFVDLSKFEKGYRGNYNRIVNSKGTVMSLNQDWGKGLDEGVHIDIIPLDATYLSENLNVKKTKKIRHIQHLIRCRIYTYEEIKKYYSLSEYKNYRYESEGQDIGMLHHQLSEIAKKGDKDSVLVGNFVTNKMQDVFDLFRKSDLENSIEMPFENMKLKVPADYDQMLQAKYGNRYMEYPSICKRVASNQYFYDMSKPYVFYQKRFFGLFKNLNGARIVLFGSGHMALDYLIENGSRYCPVRIVDNDKRKWGLKLHELEYLDVQRANAQKRCIQDRCRKALSLKIESPEYLKENAADEIRVIITSSFFREIGKQLEEMGIDYYIYVDDKKNLAES